MTLRQLIDALIEYEATHPQVASDAVFIETEVTGSDQTWYGCLPSRVGPDEEGCTTIFAVTP